MPASRPRIDSGIVWLQTVERKMPEIMSAAPANARNSATSQMFGITPIPIFDPEQKVSYLRDFMVFFRPGDIVKFRSIGREEYDQTVADVEAGRFAPPMSDVTFDLTEFQKDIDGYNAKLEGAIHGR